MDGFLDAQEIDPTFADFQRFCAGRGFPLAILSDGMDYYIRRILERHALGAWRSTPTRSGSSRRKRPEASGSRRSFPTATRSATAAPAASETTS